MLVISCVNLVIASQFILPMRIFCSVESMCDHRFWGDLLYPKMTKQFVLRLFGTIGSSKHSSSNHAVFSHCKEYSSNSFEIEESVGTGTSCNRPVCVYSLVLWLPMPPSLTRRTCVWLVSKFLLIWCSLSHFDLIYCISRTATHIQRHTLYIV